MTRTRRALLSLAAMLTSSPAQAEEPARIHPGAIELGLSGSFLSSGGSLDPSSVAVRGATLFAAGSGLGEIGTEIGYRHVRDLDRIEWSGHLAWQAPLGDGGLYPFVGAWGGFQWEKVGSFDQTRYPVGVGAGVRSLVSSRAALRIEYRYARVIDTEIESFHRHELLTGITLLLRNAP